eukprot:UN20583
MLYCIENQDRYGTANTLLLVPSTGNEFASKRKRFFWIKI